MSNPYLIDHLKVGHVLPNRWTVMAYCVSDRHAIVLCSSAEHPGSIEFATWNVSNDDLRSTANGHYLSSMELAWADFLDRVSHMYLLS